MDREREEIHSFFNTNTYSKHGTRQFNNSPPENVHNSRSGTFQPMDRKIEVMHISTQNT